MGNDHWLRISIITFIWKIDTYVANTRGGSRDSEKGEALCGPPWLTRKKILGFRWSKKAEVTLETRSFWQIISIGIFKFSVLFFHFFDKILSIFQNLLTRL